MLHKTQLLLATKMHNKLSTKHIPAINAQYAPIRQIEALRCFSNIFLLSLVLGFISKWTNQKIFKKGITKIFIREYDICACGLSKDQPFCDGSHRVTTIKPKTLRLNHKIS